MTEQYNTEVDDALNWLDKPVIDESISEFKYVDHTPQSQETLNQLGQNIRIDINSTDEYLLPSKSYLVISGQLRRADNNNAYDGTEQIALINNAMMYLFSSVQYILGNQIIETITDPGQATSILGYLRQPDDYSTSTALANCWSKDTTAFADSNKYNQSPAFAAGAAIPAGAVTPKENPNYNHGFAARRGYLFSKESRGHFEFIIPLDHIFGFAEFSKIIYGMKHTLILTRCSSDNLAIYRNDATVNGKIDLESIILKMPHIRPDPSMTMKLRKDIESRETLHINYHARSVEVTAVPPNSRSFDWRLSVSGGVEKPRWIAVAFQKDKNETQEQNPAIFDHVNLSTASVTLNSDTYPQQPIINNFALNKYAELYNMFDNFKKEYYGYNSLSGGTQVNYSTFESLYPIIVFDVRRQSERLKYGVVDIKLKCKFHQGIPANTMAHAIILSDRFYKLKSDGKNLTMVTS
jgi:hypothetical protein